MAEKTVRKDLAHDPFTSQCLPLLRNSLELCNTSDIYTHAHFVVEIPIWENVKSSTFCFRKADSYKFRFYVAAFAPAPRESLTACRNRRIRWFAAKGYIMRLSSHFMGVQSNSRASSLYTPRFIGVDSRRHGVLASYCLWPSVPLVSRKSYLTSRPKSALNC